MAEEFTFGIEEEYFLADGDTGHTPGEARLDRYHDVAARTVRSASHELLKGQVEVQSEPTTSHDAAFEALSAMRSGLARIAADQGMRLFAAGTHPLSAMREQRLTEMERYRRLAAEFGLIASRAMVCAMHVHVAVPDPDGRIGLMHRVTPFLPLFYALSAASPFWEGRNTHLKGYRLAAFSEWPRMSLPELFADQAQYDTYVSRLVGAGAIENASFVWWLIRPSSKFPTLEMRICDSCTRLDDAVAIAALYRSLLRTLHRRPDLNAGFGSVDRGVCAENIWQAQHHGVGASFIEAATGGTRTVAETLDAAIALADEDAAALGAASWMAKTRDIVSRGTSADRQLARYRGNVGAPDDIVLQGVVRSLASETVETFVS